MPRFLPVMRKKSKRKLVEHLEQNEIETRDLFPLLNQPVYRQLLKTNFNKYPVSEWLTKSGFYIGCQQGLPSKDLHRISNVFKRHSSTRSTKLISKPPRPRFITAHNWHHIAIPSRAKDPLQNPPTFESHSILLRTFNNVYKHNRIKALCLTSRRET